MPVICRFSGVIVRLYFSEHGAPHFHAQHGGDHLVVDIRSLQVMHGELPLGVQRRVLAWAQQRQTELQEAWIRARNSEEVGSIEPPSR